MIEIKFQSICFLSFPNKAQKSRQELEEAQKENQQTKDKFQEVQNQLTQVL